MTLPKVIIQNEGVRRANYFTFSTYQSFIHIYQSYVFSEAEVVQATLDMILSCCVLHEMNRQNLVKNGLLQKLDAVFDKNEIQGDFIFDLNVFFNLSYRTH